MVFEISGGLVVREKKILMTFDENVEKWTVPASEGERGELSAEAALRAVENLSGCGGEVHRYRRRLKTNYSIEEEEITWQPFSIDIEGEPENGEWVPISDLEEKELVEPLSQVREEMVDRL